MIDCLIRVAEGIYVLNNIFTYCYLYAQLLVVILTKQCVCLAILVFEQKISDFPSFVLTSGNKLENADKNDLPMSKVKFENVYLMLP